MILPRSYQRATAACLGLILGGAPFWWNDASPLWPSTYGDQAQWVLEQLMAPGFLFTTLIGHSPESFKIMVIFNVLYYGAMAYSFLYKPPAQP